MHDETDPQRPASTPGLALFQTLVQADGRSRHANQQRLRELRATAGDQVTVFSAYDASEFDRLSAATPV